MQNEVAPKIMEKCSSFSKYSQTNVVDENNITINSNNGLGHQTVPKQHFKCLFIFVNYKSDPNKPKPIFGY
jgi:hypothetical protein